jgi:hypothetical protein
MQKGDKTIRWISVSPLVRNFKASKQRGKGVRIAMSASI